MRIVNKQEFYKLPEGTLFSFYKPTVFQDINIKGDTLYREDKPVDFSYRNLVGNVNANDSYEYGEILSDAEQNKTEFQLDFYYDEREGMYDEKSLYAVYNTDEILKLANLISSCKGFD
jgi:hypothetical protein